MHLLVSEKYIDSVTHGAKIKAICNIYRSTLPTVSLRYREGRFNLSKYNGR